MEEIQLPATVKTLLLDTNTYKSPKARIITKRLCDSLFGNKFIQVDRKALFEAFNYFDGLFQSNIYASCSWQWELFIECLIYTAADHSKENMDDLKAHERSMIDKLKSISTKARELSKLMRDVDGIGSAYGLFEPDYDSPFELIVKSAETMKRSVNRVEIETACAFEKEVKPELRKALTFLKKYRPATVNLIDELADIAENEPIKYTSTTSYLQLENHKFNIFLEAFFCEINKIIDIHHLPKTLLNKEKYKYWASVFKAVLNTVIGEKAIGDAIIKHNSLKL